MKSYPRSTYFTFTDFELSDKSAIYEKFSDDIRAIAWSLETCPTTGRKHHQGYLQLYKSSRFRKVKKILGDKVHIEVMRGTVLDNEIYCEKAGRLTIKGEFTKQGKRTDIDGVNAMIKRGAPITEIIDKAPDVYYKYHAAVHKAKGYYDKERLSKPRQVEVTVLIGGTGTGKTTYVLDKYPDAFMVTKGKGNFPFDGYDGESAILFDEFNGWMDYETMLLMLHGHKASLNVKGGSTMAAWTKVFLVSNNRPVYWYDKANTANLQRRIHKIYEVTNDGDTYCILTERDKRWAFDRVGNTPYEGDAYA